MEILKVKKSGRMLVENTGKYGWFDTEGTFLRLSDEKEWRHLKAKPYIAECDEAPVKLELEEMAQAEVVTVEEINQKNSARASMADFFPANFRG